MRLPTTDSMTGKTHYTIGNAPQMIGNAPQLIGNAPQYNKKNRIVQQEMRHSKMYYRVFNINEPSPAAKAEQYQQNRKPGCIH